MSGALFTCIRANAIRPASRRPTNRTIGPTGLRMHQDEMLRKFMDELFVLARRLPSGADLLAGVQERTSRKHHGLIPADAGDDGDSLLADRADLHVAALDQILGVDDVDIIAPLIAEDGALWKQRRG